MKKIKLKTKITAILLMLSAFVSVSTAVNPVFSHDAGQSVTAAAVRNSQNETFHMGDRKVYVGGFPFGMKFYTKGVLIVGFCEESSRDRRDNPAFSAGLRIKDMITEIDGVKVKSAGHLSELIASSGGKSIKVNYTRAGKPMTAELIPKFSESEKRFRSGLWVRDSGAGIGTVTYVLPDRNAFAGLGHGICDPDSGELVPMSGGNIVGVTVSEIKKGKAGDPGEIKGFFNSGRTGTLLSNTTCGVYGIFDQMPTEISGQPLVPVAGRNEIKQGEATVRTTLDRSGMKDYKISISEIDRSADGSKCFTVKITDPRLIDKCGGIVQGMSGSPIIQNGKLIGAITHVMINDPTSGYGIFAENMMCEMQRKAA